MTHYTQHTDACLSAANAAAVEALSAQIAGYEQELANGADKFAAPILQLCNRTDDLAEIEKIAGDIRARFSQVIICGSGGSGLSGRVLSSLNLHAQKPQLYFLDNIDPSAIDALMMRCAPKNTLVITISKSGSTAETLSQFYALLAIFKTALGKETHEHFMVITMSSENPLRKTAREMGMRILDHPVDIGGRFSLFTAVGLLPAALAGVNISNLRKGAASVAKTLGESIHPARLGAALQYQHMQAGKSMTVMLPYCERLAGFSAWYRQSWAESLGKNGKGTTAIRAVGTTDQHSQLQLYLDGPNDKFFTLIVHERAGTGQKIHAPNIAGLEYLQGKTTGDIMAAEQKSTLETLVKHDRVVRVIHLENLSEESLGALIMHFMLEIFFMAKLLGVNAFDQPAVEEGKVFAREYLLSGNL